MNNYRDEAPQILCDFLSYHETIKAHSQKTVDEYFLDLRNFFRYMKQARDRSLRDTPWDEISIMDVDAAFVRAITLTDIYGYLTYLSRDRAQQQNSSRTEYGLSAATRARKIATLRSFFNYLTNKAHLLEDNPVKELDSPKLRKTLPRYLTLGESLDLLASVDGPHKERDYCILTIFLNCGLRISELIGLNLTDIQGDALRVLGKGDKKYEEFFHWAAQQYPGRMAVRLDYNEELSMAIYAGADLFLMPSKSEPCGLAQMIAMRYGTVPIVRETGGLKDTVHPYEAWCGAGNGFTFADYNSGDMFYVIRQAVELYYDKPAEFANLRKAGMTEDFSWSRSAEAYNGIYQKICS